MPARTENTIDVAAPVELTWRITNDVPNWANLFDEYAAVDILEQTPDYVRFRLTMHPDENGKVWSWVSERFLSESTRQVTARRVETGPFEFMTIEWTYEPTATGTRMTWVQTFAMKPGAPLDDEGMALRINTNTPGQMALHKAAVERVAGLALAGRRLVAADGGTITFDEYDGTPLVVVLGNRYTQKAGHQLVEALGSHPATHAVPVVQVAHLSTVPAPLQGMAKRHIAAGYRGQLTDLADRRALLGWPTTEAEGARLLRIGLDVDGVVTGAFGFGSEDRVPTVVVLDAGRRTVAELRATGHAFSEVHAVLERLAAPDGAR